MFDMEMLNDALNMLESALSLSLFLSLFFHPPHFFLSF